MIYTLQNGREVFLSRFGMVGTYAGQLEGTPETVSPHILHSLGAFAAEVLSPARPLAIIPSNRTPLPRWLCVAELGSSGVRNADPDYSSRLYVCWFTDRSDQSIDSMVTSILPQVDWDRHAEDYDVMDF